MMVDAMIEYGFLTILHISPTKLSSLSLSQTIVQKTSKELVQPSEPPAKLVVRYTPSPPISHTLVSPPPVLPLTREPPNYISSLRETSKPAKS